jgi:hypothetical protein
MQDQQIDDKIHLVADIQAMERIRNQKLEMIRIVEAQARELEDDYLEKTLSRFGNCFNAWN